MAGGGGSKYLRECQTVFSMKIKVKSPVESDGEGGAVGASKGC